VCGGASSDAPSETGTGIFRRCFWVTSALDDGEQRLGLLAARSLSSLYTPFSGLVNARYRLLRRGADSSLPGRHGSGHLICRRNGGFAPQPLALHARPFISHFVSSDAAGLLTRIERAKARVFGTPCTTPACHKQKRSKPGNRLNRLPCPQDITQDRTTIKKIDVASSRRTALARPLARWG
jgi:hypothetical protein